MQKLEESGIQSESVGPGALQAKPSGSTSISSSPLVEVAPVQIICLKPKPLDGTVSEIPVSAEDHQPSGCFCDLFSGATREPEGSRMGRIGLSNTSQALNTRLFKIKPSIGMIINAGSQPLTPVDAFGAVFNAVVSMALVLHHDIKEAPFCAAVAKLLHNYPALISRVIKSKDKTRGDCSWWESYELCSNTEMGIPLVSTKLPFSLSKAQELTSCRTGHTMLSSCQDSIPCYLQAIDTNSLKVGNGTEPLARLQLSHLSGGGTVLGLTVSHIIADGYTAAHIVHNLSAYYAKEIGQAVPILPWPAPEGHEWEQDRRLLIELLDSGVNSSNQEDQCQRNVFESVTFQPYPPGISGPKSGIGAVAAALTSAASAASMFVRETRRLGWAALGEQATVLLVIPNQDLKSMKTAVSVVAAQNVSYNDCVAGLWWLICCQVRGRPLPGQSTLNPKKQSGMFGLAADMRSNCPKGTGVVPYFNGNAACSIFARSRPSNYLDGLARPWNGPEDTDEAIKTALSASAGEGSVKLLTAACSTVRSALTAFRSVGTGARVLRSYASHASASQLQQAELLPRFMVESDAFLTSMQAVPWWTYTFGGSMGDAEAIQCIIQPMGPWGAIAIAAPPPKDALPGARSASGIALLATIPANCIDKMKRRSQDEQRAFEFETLNYGTGPEQQGSSCFRTLGSCHVQWCRGFDTELTMEFF